VDLGGLLSLILDGSISIDRIEEFAKLPKEEKIVTSDEVTINEDSSWPSAGSLTFSNFSMKYKYIWVPVALPSSHTYIV
jgi:hypothetical protein